MAETVYLLCALTSVVCAVLLTRAHRASRNPRLLGASLCFVGLAVNNVLLFVDLVVVPSIDLSLLRSGVALCAMAVLLTGLVWDSR